jgi:hypothetical protein
MRLRKRHSWTKTEYFDWRLCGAGNGNECIWWQLFAICSLIGHSINCQPSELKLCLSMCATTIFLSEKVIVHRTCFYTFSDLQDSSSARLGLWMLLHRSNHTIFYVSTVTWRVNQEKRRVQLEFMSTYKPQNAIFGIANVQFGRCKRRIGYFLDESSLTLILPQSCCSCRKEPICTRAFGSQIIYKYNQKHKGEEIYFLFWAPLLCHFCENARFS